MSLLSGWGPGAEAEGSVTAGGVPRADCCQAQKLHCGETPSGGEEGAQGEKDSPAGTDLKQQETHRTGALDKATQQKKATRVQQVWESLWSEILTCGAPETAHWRKAVQVQQMWEVV